MQSSEMTPEQKATHNEKMRLYMRNYRALKKAHKAAQDTKPDEGIAEPQSSPTSPPDAILGHSEGPVSG